MNLQKSTQSSKLKKSSFMCYFKGTSGENKQFCFPLVKTKCQYKNKSNNKQCNRDTVFGLGTCFQHLKMYKNLVIAPSRIKDKKTSKSIGRGLFTVYKNPPVVIFRKNEIICEYRGETLTEKEFEKRYGTNNSPYCLGPENSDHKLTSVDGLLQRSIGSLINHQEEKYTNAFYSTTFSSDGTCSYYVIAKRDIYSDEEIYVNYGSQYVMGGNEYGLFATLPKHSKPPSWYT